VAKSDSEEFSDYGKFLWAHRGVILFGGSRVEQLTAFLEFEWIFGLGVAFVILLMIIFYVVYPYDKDLKDVPLD
jgi:hypothetical protein